jgi:hypothetical protein
MTPERTYNIAAYIRREFAKQLKVPTTNVFVFNDNANECIHVIVKHDNYNHSNYFFQIGSDDDEYHFVNVNSTTLDRSLSEIDEVKFDIPIETVSCDFVFDEQLVTIDESKLDLDYYNS